MGEAAQQDQRADGEHQRIDAELADDRALYAADTMPAAVATARQPTRPSAEVSTAITAGQRRHRADGQVKLAGDDGHRQAQRRQPDQREALQHREHARLAAKRRRDGGDDDPRHRQHDQRQDIGPDAFPPLHHRQTPLRRNRSSTMTMAQTMPPWTASRPPVLKSLSTIMLEMTAMITAPIAERRGEP